MPPSSNTPIQWLATSWIQNNHSFGRYLLHSNTQGRDRETYRRRSVTQTLGLGEKWKEVIKVYGLYFHFNDTALFEISTSKGRAGKTNLCFDRYCVSCIFQVFKVYKIKFVYVDNFLDNNNVERKSYIFGTIWTKSTRPLGQYKRRSIRNT